MGKEQEALERIIFFSDAIIAIVITLMVLDIRIPDGLASGELSQALLALWPKYFSYVISFLVIGMYWVEHHRMFKYIKRYDGRLIWLNLLFLMSIAFIPFSTDLLGEYGDEPVAVRVYAGLLVVVGMMKWAMWKYATHNHRLVSENLSEHIIEMSNILGLIAPAVFLVSIGISLYSPTLATLSWIATGPLIAGVRQVWGVHTGEEGR